MKGPTRQFEPKVFYGPAEQVSSLIQTPLAGSGVAEGGHHHVYDPAGNISSKQVEKPGLAATMTTYAHNSLDQLMKSALKPISPCGHVAFTRNPRCYRWRSVQPVVSRRTFHMQLRNPGVRRGSRKPRGWKSRRSN